MPAIRTYRVGHLCCGIGGGEKGFKDARFSVGNVNGRFECAGGVDIDAGAIRNFNRVAPGRGVVMDLFDEEQYRVFHDAAPPPGWREKAPDDIRTAFGDGPLDVLFASMPCKGFSGLLSEKKSTTPKYEALNRLTLRGVWLALEAYKDDPISIILFENVPRIENRGRPLLQRIEALLAHYGYVFAETKHDCGEIGGLAQSRKRFLLVARHVKKVPPFLYEPTKHRLRGVGEVIGQLPLPGDPSAGAMHRVPRLQWKTWVRLAFVPPGKDWRALNELAVVDGVLRDFGIVPERGMRDNQLGVIGWDETAPTITSQRAPGQGRFAVADPRVESHKFTGSGRLGVRDWSEPTGAVAGASRPENGAYNVADPRPDGHPHHGTLGVTEWEEPSGVVTGASRPANGPHSVADPRPQQANQSFAQYGVREWDEPAGTVTGQSAPGGGPNSVADPRLNTERPRFNNVFRIVPFDEPSPAVAGPGGAGGGVAVADPRSDTAFGGKGKYRITSYDEPAGTVIGGSTTGQGAFAVADPKPGYSDNTHHNVLRVTPYDEPAGTITSGHGPTTGAISVADPRPVGLNAVGREGYATQGHYGVVDWEDPSGAVPGYAKFDRGNWSVADPRDQDGEPGFTLPAANEKIVARIIARDGTWHRPFTTLELAALQSLFDPGEVFDLEGGSDQLKREWIGNAVPSAAARGMAETIGETLLRAEMGETFTLSSREIWTRPLALALAVDPRQFVYGEWVGGAAA